MEPGHLGPSMGSDRCTRVGRSRGYGAELEELVGCGPEEQETETPASALRELAHTYFEGQVRVQL